MLKMTFSPPTMRKVSTMWRTCTGIIMMRPMRRVQLVEVSQSSLVLTADAAERAREKGEGSCQGHLEEREWSGRSGGVHYNVARQLDNSVGIGAWSKSPLLASPADDGATVFAHGDAINLCVKWNPSFRPHMTSVVWFGCVCGFFA